MTQETGNPSEPRSESPDFVGHCLLRLATLSAALAGGGIFLLTDWTLGTAFRVATGLCVGAFACAVGGLLKRTDARGAVLPVETKWRWFKSSAVLLFAGLTTGLLGAVFR